MVGTTNDGDGGNVDVNGVWIQCAGGAADDGCGSGDSSADSDPPSRCCNGVATDGTDSGGDDDGTNALLGSPTGEPTGGNGPSEPRAAMGLDSNSDGIALTPAGGSIGDPAGECAAAPDVVDGCDRAAAAATGADTVVVGSAAALPMVDRDANDSPSAVLTVDGAALAVDCGVLTVLASTGAELAVSTVPMAPGWCAAVVVVVVGVVVVTVDVDTAAVGR